MHHLALQIPFHSVESKLAQGLAPGLRHNLVPRAFPICFLEKSRGNEVACDKDTNCFSIVLIFEKFDIVDVAPGKGIQEIFSPVECETLILGIRNTAQGIRNPTSNYDPESKFHRQRLASSTWNSEFKYPRLSGIPFHGAIDGYSLLLMRVQMVTETLIFVT